MKNKIKQILYIGISLATITLSTLVAEGSINYLEKQKATLKHTESFKYGSKMDLWGIDKDEDGTIDKIIVEETGYLQPSVRFPRFSRYCLEESDLLFDKMNKILEENKNATKRIW